MSKDLHERINKVNIPLECCANGCRYCVLDDIKFEFKK